MIKVYLLYSLNPQGITNKGIFSTIEKAKAVADPGDWIGSFDLNQKVDDIGVVSLQEVGQESNAEKA